LTADGVGGLVGLADLVTVTSSYSISTFNTGVVGGGLFGQETCDPEYVPDVSNTYVVGSGTTYGIQKLNCGEFDSTFWNSSLSPNTATAADPLVGAVAKTTAQLKAFATYPASWNIVDGWDVFSASAPLKTWGICSSVNEGYPYLLWEYTTNPCVAQSPPPQAPAASTAPTTLATTGAEVEWLAIGSLIAVAAGAGFFALGRRKRA
jgi:LPXTG-motif cell wall-anchored protein